jgi:hypothetical protein
VERIRSTGKGVSFSGVKERVLDVMRRTHLLEKIGEENIYPTLEGAIKALYIAVHPQGEDVCGCPLMSYMPKTGGMGASEPA